MEDPIATGHIAQNSTMKCKRPAVLFCLAAHVISILISPRSPFALSFPSNMRGFVLVVLSALAAFPTAIWTTQSVAAAHSIRHECRRKWIRSMGMGFISGDLANMIQPTISFAKTVPTEPAVISPLSNLLEAQNTLSILLENWIRATVDCTYADVPRELLEAKNKDLLLEKASTFALFDKSVSVETCKTTNRIVRDYLGVTGKGPLVGIDKKIRQGLEFIDPDDLEDYLAGKFSSVSNK